MLNLNIKQVLDLSISILQKYNTSKSNATSVSNALVAAQVNGQSGHGLIRLASYVNQLKSGKIEGDAKPSINQIMPSLSRVDAKYGFAYPALDLSIKHIVQSVKNTGVCISTIFHSHHCGMLGYYVDKLAQEGYVSIMFANSPQAIAPWGGQKGVFGTNPIAFGAPRSKGKLPIIIDMSMSKIARGKILHHSKTDNIIEESIALDRNGNPTTNATEALEGVLLPIAGAKGSALCLMIEIMSAVLSGSNIGYEASSFLDSKGRYPNVGQTIIAFDQNLLSGNQYDAKIEDLCKYILEQDGTKLPGDKKIQFNKLSENELINIEDKLYNNLIKLLN